MLTISRSLRPHKKGHRVLRRDVQNPTHALGLLIDSVKMDLDGKGHCNLF